MEGNCKRSCRKGSGTAFYDEQCEACVIKVLGQSCYDCFGFCFRNKGYMDHKYIAGDSIVPVEQARLMRTEFLHRCPRACPKDTIAIMEDKCKRYCRKDTGTAFYDSGCENCVIRNLGGSCYDCFGQCFLDMYFPDPLVYEPSVVPVPEARELRSHCLKECPDSCPKNTITLMETNCKRHCRKGSGTAFYDEECEECLIDVLGMPCYDCFGLCFRNKGYLDHKIVAGKSVVPTYNARQMRSECIKRCPRACPSNTIQIMEANCKPACKKEGGTDFYDDDCEACVVRVLGVECYDCFGQCFVDMGYLDPDVYEPSVVPVPEARTLRSECLEFCPTDCPSNTIYLMEGNCKRHCRRGSGTAFYDKECEECVLRVLGRPCWDCFGQCFRNKGYLDHKLEKLGGPSVVPVEHARPMRSECLRRCPSDCPTNTIELMEANCKPSCRKEHGTDFYDPDCEACVIRVLGGPCYDCFGQCFIDMYYPDPHLHEPSVVPVPEARILRSECLEFCPTDCPRNTIELMEGNCKRDCRKGSGTAFYDEECEACVLRVLGRSCWDCFGQCFRNKGYLDHKLANLGGPSVVPVEHARPMRSECLRRCPSD